MAGFDKRNLFRRNIHNVFIKREANRHLFALDGVLLYLLVWLVVFIGYMLKFRTIPTLVLRDFFLFSLCFIIGYFSIKPNNRPIIATREINDLIKKRWMKTFLAIQFIALFLSLAGTINVIIQYGLRSVFINMDWRMSAAAIALNGSILDYGPIFAYISLVLGVSLREYSLPVPRILDLINFFLLFLTMFNTRTARRNYFFEALISALFIFVWSRKGAKLRRQIMLLASILIIIVIIFSWSQSKLGKSLGSSREDVFSYILLNIDNADFYLHQEPRLGSRTLYLPNLVLAKISGKERPRFLNPINFELGGFNTLPYFAEWYVDSGYIGAILFSLLWGVGCRLAKKRARISPYWLCLYGVLQSSILFSFRTCIVAHYEFVFMILLFIILNFYVLGLRRGQKPASIVVVR